jgi:hypothetical protein
LFDGGSSKHGIRFFDISCGEEPPAGQLLMTMKLKVTALAVDMKPVTRLE